MKTEKLIKSPMKNIAIIPARGGSKRLPNKNILPLGELPLLVHSIIFAKTNAKIIGEVYVSTDCEKIKAVALQYGAKVIDRPATISGDLEPTISTLQHVLQAIDYKVDNVVLLQPTNPLRPQNLLHEAFSLYIDKKVDSLFTVSRNHHKLGKISNNKFYPFNYKIGQRSQDLEPLYFENGLLYIANVNTILEGKIISENAIPLEVNHIFASVDIDTQADFDYAKFLISTGNYSSLEKG